MRAVSPRAAGALAALACAGALGGCDPGQGPDMGMTEPMQTNGQFVAGALPGTFAADASISGTGEGGGPLAITQVTLSVPNVEPGAASELIGGWASNDTSSVGMELQDLGTGYWIVPAGPIDPSNPSSVPFGTIAGFQPTVTSGVHNLLLAALDGSGRGGLQYHVPICFENVIPDNGHVCNPATQPPAAVFTLQWDTNFDLDLHVVTPSGVELSPENPYGPNPAIDAGPSTVLNPDLPHIDRDALRDCIPNGLRQEDAIFQKPLAPGVYTVYVDPYASCGVADAHFVFTLSETSGSCPKCQFGPVGSTVAGTVTASQVTGGQLPPLKIDAIAVGP